MKRTLQSVEVLLFVSALAILAYAGSASDVSPREKAMAKTHAKLDAYRLLRERILGLSLDSWGRFYVSDVVEQSQEIETAFKETLIKGATIAAEKYNEVGLWEVHMEITVQEVEAWLKLVQAHGNWGNKITFELEELRVGPVNFTVVGFGPVAGTRGAELFKSYRAAIVDGYNNLAERVLGLQLTAESKVKDLALDYDDVKTHLSHELRGARVVRVHFKKDDSCIVKMEITVRQVIAKLENLHRHEGIFRHGDYKWEKISTYTQDVVVGAEGEGCPKDETEEMPEQPEEGLEGANRENEVIVIIEEKPIVK